MKKVKDRLLSTLGICKKAGKVIMGFEAVREAAALGQVSLIVLSGDLSPKSGKEIAFTAEKQNIPVCTAPITMEEIQSRLGKRSGILAITDRGLADTVLRTASRAIEEESSI